MTFLKILKFSIDKSRSCLFGRNRMHNFLMFSDLLTVDKILIISRNTLVTQCLHEEKAKINLDNDKFNWICISINFLISISMKSSSSLYQDLYPLLFHVLGIKELQSKDKFSFLPFSVWISLLIKIQLTARE